MLKILEEKQAYIESILHDIKHISEEVLQKYVTRRQFHETMQRRIISLATSFNLKGLSEYRVHNIRANRRDALIDVVWLTDVEPLTVFEIDSSTRAKSVKKLLAAKVPFRFWIYYGSRDPKPLIHKYDPDSLIQIIRLQGIHFKRKRKRRNRNKRAKNIV